MRGGLPRPCSSGGPRCSSPASSLGCRKPARQQSPPPPGLLGPGLRPAASLSSQDRRSRGLSLLSGPQVPRPLSPLRNTGPHSLFLLSGLQILTASLLSGLNVPAASLLSGLQVLTSCLSSQDFRSSFADIDSLLEIEPRNGPAQKLRQEVNRSLN